MKNKLMCPMCGRIDCNFSFEIDKKTNEAIGWKAECKICGFIEKGSLISKETKNSLTKAIDMKWQTSMAEYVTRKDSTIKRRETLIYFVVNEMLKFHGGQPAEQGVKK